MHVCARCPVALNEVEGNEANRKWIPARAPRLGWRDTSITEVSARSAGGKVDIVATVDPPRSTHLLSGLDPLVGTLCCVLEGNYSNVTDKKQP